MRKESYFVRHITEFFYSAPISESAMLLCMRPLEDERQKIKRYDLKISPSASVFESKDHFGNARHIFSLLKEYKELKIESSFMAFVKEPEPLPEFAGAGEWEKAQKLSQERDFWDWLAPGYFARPSDLLKKFLLDEGIERRKDPLLSLKNLNARLFSLFKYKPQSTKANSPIEEILSRRQGVCQDYAHVMIAISRLWGIPSRYVSGYLFQEKGEREARGLSDESHAWCECYLPSLGWIGFDPANNSRTGLQHIRAAVGGDYKDVAPHAGFFKGAAEEKLKVRVTVKKL